MVRERLALEQGLKVFQRNAWEWALASMVGARAICRENTGVVLLGAIQRASDLQQEFLSGVRWQQYRRHAFAGHLLQVP